VIGRNSCDCSTWLKAACCVVETCLVHCAGHSLVEAAVLVNNLKIVGAAKRHQPNVVIVEAGELCGCVVQPHNLPHELTDNE
jgi:hypothetical protein